MLEGEEWIKCLESEKWIWDKEWCDLLREIDSLKL